MTLSPPEREHLEEREEADGTAARRRNAAKYAKRDQENYFRRLATGRIDPANYDPWEQK